MAKYAVFTLPGKPPEKVTVNNRYEFVNGKMIRNESDGVLLEPVLCAYYGCTLTWESDTPPQTSTSEVKPTLAKSETVRAKQ